MAQDDPTGWELIDPRPIAVEAPYTYYLPSNAELAALGVGDLAKLVFAYNGPVDEYGVERMWVNITETTQDELAGLLDNTPFEPRSPLRPGDMIRFERHHVIDMLWKHPEQAPPAQPSRQYWDRCLVDQCVLDGEEPVEYLYRETPDMAQEGDTHPDSGWRIRGRRGTATAEEYDAREFVYIALGKVLNEDDSWLHLIDMPVGCQFERDFVSGDYLRRA